MHPALFVGVSAIIGGWWTRPSNWKSNTAILFGGILAVTYGVWTLSADKEVRPAIPSLPIISLLSSSTRLVLLRACTFVLYTKIYCY